jgi:GMP synthase (glutamine-hydrolysing)
MILIVDFGSQYTQLIARRIREFNVYCEIHPYNSLEFEVKNSEFKGSVASKRKIEISSVSRVQSIKGVIFSGGPESVYEKNSPKMSVSVLNYFLENKIPILGICYGMQLLSYVFNGEVIKSKIHEYGLSEIKFVNKSLLFTNIPKKTFVWMSHGDTIKKLPYGFTTIAFTENNLIAAAQNLDKKIYMLQFHPEVKHTKYGIQVLKNFVFKICSEKPTWQMKNFIKTAIEEIKNTVGDKPVICALSGGVDSSVVSTLVYKAIGKNLHCVFVDNGVLRYGEKERVEKIFKPVFGKNLHIVVAGKIFLSNLKGVTNP